ncbi:hypothetical protein H4S02_008887 [Coemansia sp. RSA 2611]|nr:hypothetical protein H4S02_008887 [Coemansia sp. RSA 2611]KAJ2714939.1 hypothetical protein H4R23_005685 [Coemansia sp. Cherry 401B]
MRLISVGYLSLLGLAAGKTSTSGIEFVRACDSGSDDVTNQCINRIPDDIGRSSGNHACAYHEAEVRCLGLCGNTVTWKVAYTNALKRYRLVCASYIDERMAEKEESGEAGDDEPKRAPKKQKARDDEEQPDDEGDEAKKQKDEAKKGEAKKDDDAKKDDEAKKGDEKKPAKAETTKPGSSKSGGSKTESKASKSDAPTKSTSESMSETSKPTLTLTRDSSSGSSSRHSDKSSTRSGKNKPHMLPTMDPELADSAPGPRSLGLAALLLTAAAALF